MAILCNTIRALCTIAAAGVLGACTGPGAAESVKSGPYTLVQGQSVTLAPMLSLRFDSVNDSRCPQGVTCVWAGELRYHFTLHGGADEAFVLSERAPRFSSARRKGLSVALEKSPAAPLPGASEAPPNHPVTLRVSTT